MRAPARWAPLWVVRRNRIPHLTFVIIQAGGDHDGRIRQAVLAIAEGVAQHADNFQPPDGMLHRLAPPVDADITEQPILDLIPHTGARRQVTHVERQFHVIRQVLELAFPQPAAAPIAPVIIGADEEVSGVEIAHLADRGPQAPDGRHREGRRIMVHPDVYPAYIQPHNIHAIGERHPVREIG